MVQTKETVACKMGVRLGGGESYEKVGVVRKYGHFQGHIIVFITGGKQVIKPSHLLPEGKEEDRTS
jgi:hypothetical protein